jgi:hypothetical protein
MTKSNRRLLRRPSFRPSPEREPGSGVIEIENVIPKLYQDQIEAEATSDAMAWYFHAESARPDLNFSQSFGGFFHMAYDAAVVASPVRSAINAALVPVLFMFCEKAQIGFHSLLRVRLGLFTRTLLDVKFHNPHVDSEEPHGVALYYVNESDGDTVVFKETSADVPIPESAEHANAGRFTELKRIPPRRGKMAYFDGKHYHASMHPMRHASRIVITFNFTTS